jgi:hypothetical protein
MMNNRCIHTSFLIALLGLGLYVSYLTVKILSLEEEFTEAQQQLLWLP